MDAHIVSRQHLDNARFFFQVRLDDSQLGMPREGAQLPRRPHHGSDLMPVLQQLAQDVEANVPPGTS
jgi:hypothetical protein